MNVPKYALIERERKWLVDPERLPDLSRLNARLVEDRYLDGGRLRLRKITTIVVSNSVETADVVYKLCKKYGNAAVESPYEEPIVNIYLTATEYESFSALPGCCLRKTRYSYTFAEQRFSLDVFAMPFSDLILCECETQTVAELLALRPPPFAVQEVTGDVCYSGAYLAREENKQ